MKTILICGYRNWSYDIYKNLSEQDIKFDYNLIYVDDKDELEMVIHRYNPEMIFFVGWSWIIQDKIINTYKCICLHPSSLPKYRGGSPIQHQIINGETESAVTLFRMDSGIDTGDILYQESFSLDGNLRDIFTRIVSIGHKGIRKIILGDYTITKQDESKATFFKRRTKDTSEIKIEDFNNFTAKEIHNKIRALQSPYPNAFIVCKDGTKLFIEYSKHGEQK